MKKGFTLIELLIVIAIIGILSSVGLNTFTSSQKKSRDAKRKSHLSQLAATFEAYYNDKKQYPDDAGGSLKVCASPDFNTACVWGTDSLTDDKGTVYMVKLPSDPVSGLTYYYDANTVSDKQTGYRLYARLENLKDPAVLKDNKPQIYENISCGSLTCNYGVSSSNLALPATIDEP